MNFATISRGLSVTFVSSSLSFGAGFQLQEASAVGLGRAFSGEASIGDDASILGANPAGMILLGGTNYSGSLSYIRPGAEVTGEFTSAAAPGSPFPVRSDDVGEEVVVPAFYLTHQLNEKVTIGIGSFTTYGLGTNYEPSFGALSVADRSSLQSVNVQPTIAYRVNDKFSVGAGFNILYAKGKLNSSLPGGTEILGLEGDDIGYGYNLGFLYQFTPDTRIGLHYRSKVKLKLEGETDFIGNPAFGIAPLDGASTSLSVELPETLQLSAFHKINPSWAIHGDAKWTAWSRYDGLAPQIPSSPQVTAISRADADWENAMRYSIGVTHYYSDKLTLRAGIAHDESPTSSADRTLRIPDEDRFWLTFGFTYAVNQNMNFDFGYAHIFIDDAALNDGNGTGSFRGTASGDVDIVSVGISGNF